jgi:Cdc6-like AAA superfamily ATPase
MTNFDQRYQQVQTQYNAAQITIMQQAPSFSDKQRKHNRDSMLDRVQSIWIDGVLEPSLQGAAQIMLTLASRPDAVSTPFQQVLQEFDRARPLLPAGTHIGQIYDHANGEVLILGEPGAGKTTLLLELTRDLLQRARQDETYPIPIVFSLSSWAATHLPLTEWLVLELTGKYQISRDLARYLVQTDQVLPLLDGLDEVSTDSRETCVTAINSYRQGHGSVPTIVTSRL